jgi:D-tyrosyl-tRNA(Tyr) deacylase
MKLLVQRVLSASVAVKGQCVAKIDQGLLVLVGFGHHDQTRTLEKAVDKLINLRIFSDQRGRFQYSLLDQDKGLLAVPQFTLYGRTQSGRRPDFTAAMAPPEAEKFFNLFSQLLQNEPVKPTGFGVFGADMQVSLVNDGPVTLMLEID